MKVIRGDQFGHKRKFLVELKPAIIRDEGTSEEKVLRAPKCACSRGTNGDLLTFDTAEAAADFINKHAGAPRARDRQLEAREHGGD